MRQDKEHCSVAKPKSSNNYCYCDDRWSLKCRVLAILIAQPMSWSITIARIAGTAVRIHITFLLFILWIAASNYSSRGLAAAQSSVVLIVLVFACVVAHEFGHILMARSFGVKTRDITLWPIGGVAHIERIPDDPSQELMIAIAGPLVNVIIAALLILVGGVSLSGLTTIDFENALLMQHLALINISLVVFNLIPAFPMDGGRIFKALLAMWLGGQKALEIASRAGQAFAFIFVAAGLFLNPMLIFIGLFIYIAALLELQTSSIHRLADGLKVSDAVERRVQGLSATATLSDAINALLSSPQQAFPVLDDANFVLGTLDRGDLTLGLKKYGPETAVTAVMREPAVIRSSDSLSDAIKDMAQKGHKMQIVIDHHGHFSGILTLENFAEMMIIKDASPKWNFHNHRK
jgi:stage IV sporulation protein FB